MRWPPRSAERCTALLFSALLASATVASTAAAQETITVDQAVARARSMVEAGEGRAGRILLDSLVARAPIGSPALGELLYWRGLLSASGMDAEHDWRRLLLEVPMSPRAEDAMLRLAQLDLLRGKPTDARVLLDRLAQDYADPASQARAHFWLAKSFFDENDAPRACGALAVARQHAPSNAVELRTQVDDLASRCRGVTAVQTRRAVATAEPSPEVRAAPIESRAPTRTATASPPPVVEPPRRAAASATNSAATNAAPADARFSVQLAAYSRLDQAQALVKRLAARQIDARVDGTSAPFRVRTGYFVTRAAAEARLVEFKRQGQDGFVAELSP